MTKFASFFLFGLVAISLAATAAEIPQTIMDRLTENDNMGKEFYIAIPQNDVKHGQAEETVAIYIASFKDCRVTISMPKYGFEWIKEVEAGKPLVLSNDNGGCDFIWEVINSEVVENMGVHIKSDAPISVYVLNSRSMSSDGYLALPMDRWGKQYVHLAYYDHKEQWPSRIRRGSGFIVVAGHDRTSLTINLRGRGGEAGATVGGHKIGETIRVSNMNAGDVYMVRGNAQTDQGFDLSGTLIQATKPVGVISFHQRTMIPNESPSGRDHLCEMIPPTQTWGKNFVTVAFNRGGQGDFIRIAALEDGTQIEGDSYQPGTNNAYEDGHYSQKLKAGEFFEFLQTVCHNNNKQNGVRGVTVWKSNKPVMLAQYAYSYPWDGDRNWDPLMIVIPPVEQYKKSIVFQTPYGAGFNKNEVTILAVGNPNDPDRKLLKTVYLDGEQVAEKEPMFMYQRAGETNIFWARLQIDPGVHFLTSETKLAGYVDGFAGYNSYGWPLLMGLDKIDETDTLPPLITLRSKSCGEFNYEATERRNEGEQKDQGLRDVFLVEEMSNNVEMKILKEDFSPAEGEYDVNFVIKVLDLSKDAKAVFGAIDRAGNFVVDTLFYEGWTAKGEPSVLDFGNSRINKTYEKDYVVSNLGKDTLSINAASFKGVGGGFRIAACRPSEPPFELPPNESATITAEFSPTIEKDYADTLIVEFECFDLRVPAAGRGVEAKILISDWDFGNVKVGSSVSIYDQNGYGFPVKNVGTDTITVFDIKNVNPPFSISKTISPPLPKKLEPGEQVYFNSIIFAPTDTGSYRNETLIVSDAENDSISVWTGTAYTETKAEDGIKGLKIELSPNPAKDKSLLKLVSEKETEASVKVYSLNGAVVLDKGKIKIPAGETNLKLDLSGLSSGIYYLTVESGTGKSSATIIVNK